MFPHMMILAQAPIQFASPLGAVAWAVLAGVPVGIVALYFLKLRRRPVQVSSTLLWKRSIEDLHVNSLFQRLRRNLLLFLQLLAVLLAMLALAGPRLKGTTGSGQRYVLVIDESASMGSLDIKPTRLAKAKEEAKKIVSEMESSDLAMVIAFSDRARVVSTYTGNRSLLSQRIDGIKPTEAATSLREALQVASGLANPSKQVGEGVVASGVNPPKMFLFTDGGFPDVEGFSLGNLEPEVVVIGPAPAPVEAPSGPTEKKKGPEPSDNVAILALQANRNEEKPDRFQVFGRAHNYRGEAISTEARLFRLDPKKPNGGGTLIDAVALKIDPQSDQAFKFDLEDNGGSSELEVRIDLKDDLPVDNSAFTVFGHPRKAQVLLVTPGNRYLIDALKTATAEALLDLAQTTPEGYKTDAYTRDVANGRYDLVIFDGVRPDTNPEANTLYFGALPPGKMFENSKVVENPAILDWDIGHPLLHHVQDLRLVLIFKALIVEPPPGATTLIDSNLGPLGLIVPRSGFTDAVLTFGFRNGADFNTDWPKYLSFPLFLYNALKTLGNASDSTGNEVHRPGQPVVLRADSQATSIEVTSPTGLKDSPKRTPQGTFVYNGATETGIYRVRWGKDSSTAFAVNLFDLRESDLSPRGIVPSGVPESQAEQYKIKIGFNPVKGTRRTAPAVKDWWWPVTLVVLGVVLFEWYIYNRRVYI